MEPKEWYKASELTKDLDIKERITRELLNELEEKGVTKGKRYRKNNKKWVRVYKHGLFSFYINLT